MEDSFADQLDVCDKELEVNRIALSDNAPGLSCRVFLKGRQKGRRTRPRIEGYRSDLLRWGADDPPERASRIRSQVLERYYNKLTEGEQSIREKQHEIQRQIHRMVKDIEREYQRRLRGINKEFNRICHGVKEQLLEVSTLLIMFMVIEKTRSAFCVHRTSREGSKSSHVGYRNEQWYPHWTHESSSGCLLFWGLSM